MFWVWVRYIKVYRCVFKPGHFGPRLCMLDIIRTKLVGEPWATEYFAQRADKKLQTLVNYVNKARIDVARLVSLLPVSLQNFPRRRQVYGQSDSYLWQLYGASPHIVQTTEYLLMFPFIHDTRKSVLKNLSNPTVVHILVFFLKGHDHNGKSVGDTVPALVAPSNWSDYFFVVNIKMVNCY